MTAGLAARWLLVLSALIPAVLMAQDSTHGRHSTPSRRLHPGSDDEGYLRYLQTLGLVPGHPWSLRAFSSVELALLGSTDANHPRASAVSLQVTPGRLGRFHVEFEPIAVSAWYNTSFPFGINDGAVWMGRGATVQAQFGAIGTIGPLQLRMAPTGFWTENRGFPLAPTHPRASIFADPRYPTSVDRPQRFGPSSYGRGDLGESEVRLDGFGMAVGLSHARQWWGPMSDFPLILGTNAPGFAHAFLGSTSSMNVGVGRTSWRIIYGRLEQTPYSPDSTGSGRRFVTGAIAVLQPRALRGLEIGASRFYHVEWPAAGLSSRYFTHLFEPFLKSRVRPLDPAGDPGGSSTDNQLASVFARWVLPRSGFEVYGEYGREDHNGTFRDLLGEPDHAAAYGLGIRRGWLRSTDLVAVRAEVFNFQTSTLQRHRGQEAWYRHEYTPQGHTHRGQLLAAAIGVGSGAGASLALERFAATTVDRVSLSRYVVDNLGDVRNTEALYAIHGEHRWMPSSRVEFFAAVDQVMALNRSGADNAANTRLGVGSTFFP